MSTTVESAQAWIIEKKPTLDEIKNTLTKLESRIDNWTGEEDQIQGSIDAALFLQSQLEPQTPKVESNEPPQYFDTSALIPNADPIELEESIKQKTFEALKAQLGKIL